MSKQQYADDDFEIIKGVRVLKDKRSITVGLAMMDSMDSMQRAIANNGNRKSRITDGSSDPLALHKPGHRMFVDTERDMSFYDSYDRRISREYLRGDAIGERGHVAGETCTVRNSNDIGEQGDRGHFRNVAGVGLVCVSDTPARGRTDARDGQNYRQYLDGLYRERDFADANAWRDGNKKTLARDPQGRELETWETEEDDDEEDCDENGGR